MHASRAEGWRHRGGAPASDPRRALAGLVPRLALLGVAWSSWLERSAGTPPTHSQEDVLLPALLPALWSGARACLRERPDYTTPTPTKAAHRI